MKSIHLICNAHIDPVWMWNLDEGVAETLSTYRVAADFCEQYDGFIFNHNEAMLYQWVEEYEPALFKRIQKLVAEKKWHIMGGWFLQPDCNLTAGESFVRQIITGKNYFMEKFGVEPRTCVNFDAFGHSRGLVEILAKSGHDSYIFCRPEPDMIDLPGEDFNWVGFRGSKIACHRAYNSYESHRGEADKKIEGWLQRNSDSDVGIVLWGIGNHGGGPSRTDWELIEALNARLTEHELIHSIPENYFDSIDKSALPDYHGLMNPRYTGCYTSQILIKQLHRRLEDELYMTEKMAAHAAFNGLMTYPEQAVKSAANDMMVLEFHDILPGSAVASVEDYSKNLAGHGLSELQKVKTQAFLALCSNQEKAEDGTIPVMVYNPHPYTVSEIVECEYQLPDQNKNRDLFALPSVYKDGELIASQCEHEVSNFNVDWRKKSVFRAQLKPFEVTRFDIKIDLIKNPAPLPKNNDKSIRFTGADMSAEINTLTGTLDSYVVGGVEYIKKSGFLPIVVKDDENSWAHKEKSFREVVGTFAPMAPPRAAEFSGIIDGSQPASVRVIEDGDIRTIVEAVMEYSHSQAVLRYFLPKKGTEIKVEFKVYWNEKMRMLKLSIPVDVNVNRFTGQTAYGSENLYLNGDEMVSHKWNVVSGGGKAVSVINSGTYGSDCLDSELRVTCLRSPGYAAGKSDFSIRKPYIMEQDRFSPFIDQGERDFVFYLNASDEKSRLELIERESCVKSEKPTVLSFFPSGDKRELKPFASLSDDVITIPVFKRAEKVDGFIIRLFNPTKETRATRLTIPLLSLEREITLEGLDFRSYFLDNGGAFYETDLLERRL